MSVRNANWGRIAFWLICFLFVFGVLVPSSISTVMHMIPLYIAPAVTFLVLLAIILIGKKMDFKFLASVLLMNFIVWAATLFNPGERVRNVAGGTYILLSLLFIANFKNIPIGKSIKTVFNVVNFLLIIIGFAMVSYNQLIYNIFVDYYSDFYQELVPNMLARGKPILTFGTHSLAAFYLFIFFYLNIRTYASNKKIIYFLASISYLYFCVALQSNSGYVFLLFGVGVLIFNLRHKIISLSVVTATILLIMIFNPVETKVYLDTVQLNIETATLSSSHGIDGRYSEEGNQAADIRHIVDNPFKPTGLSMAFGSELTYHDSGLIATTLEGTIILTVLLYGTLFVFLKRNIVNNKNALIIFFSLMLIQLGYNNLFYFRAVCIIPFVILYLNSLEENANDAKTPSKWSNRILTKYSS